MFDSGTRTKTTSQRWCFPDRSSNVVLAACVFQQWFLIVLHDTDICRQLGWDRQRARPKPCNHMKWDCLSIKTTCSRDSPQTSAESSVVAVETHKPAGEICSGFQPLHPFNISALQSHPTRTRALLFPDSMEGFCLQLSCCRPSVTW